MRATRRRRLEARVVELRTLGALSVHGPDGSELHALVTQPKRLALLVHLCLATRRNFHRRDTLLGLFWPESDEAHARASLRKALHVLRRAVGEDAIVSRGEEEVRVDLDAVRCDAVAFQDHAAAGRLAEAMALYRGDLLPGFFLSDLPEFERWLERERSHLRDLATRTAQRLTDRLESEGKLAEAVAAARTAVSLAQMDERLVRRLLGLLDRVGDRTGAVSAYDDFVRLVAVPAGVEPSRETRELIGQIRTHRAAVRSSSDRDVRQPVATHSLVEPPPVAPEPSDVTTIESRSERPRRSRRLLLFAILACLAGLIVAGTTLMRPRTSRVPRVTVLPLENLSRDSADRYFAETMHEELVSRLGMIPSIRVTSRNSVLRYRGGPVTTRSIARELGADFVLEGSAARDPNRVYVSARLIDARTDAQLWRHSYAESRSVGNLFDIQADIARRVAEALEVRVGAAIRGRVGNHPTESDAAYAAYLDASRREIRESREENVAAEALLKYALALDPDFPVALAALAEVYQVRAYVLGDSRAWADSGLVLARMALKSDSTLLAGYHALGYGNLELGHLRESRIAYQKIVDLHPSDGQALMVLGWIEFLQGRPDRALAIWADTRAVDPMNRTVLGDVGLVEILFGDYERAGKWHQAARALGPLGGLTGFGPVRSMIAQGKAADASTTVEQQLVRNPRSFEGRGLAATAAIGAGNLERARQHLEEMHRTSPDNWDYWGTTHRTSYAYVLSKSGRAEYARALLDTTLGHAMRLIAEGDERPGVRREIAAIHAARGDSARAFEWLEKAIEAGWRHEALRPTPLFEPLRASPRFKMLMQRMNADIARARKRVRSENLGPPLPSS